MAKYRTTLVVDFFITAKNSNERWDKLSVIQRLMDGTIRNAKKNKLLRKADWFYTSFPEKL